MGTRIAEAKFISNLERKLDDNQDYWTDVQAQVDSFNEHHCIWKGNVIVTLDEMHEEFYGSQNYNDWRRSLDSAPNHEKPEIARKFNQLKHDFIQSEIEALCEFIVGEQQ